MRKEFRRVTSKLPIDTYTQFLAYCDKQGTKPSGTVRELIGQAIQDVIPLNKAGINSIEYNRKNDTFNWSIIFDDGTRNEIATDLSEAFVENLRKSVTDAMSSRNNYTKKKIPHSVAVPTKIKKLVNENVKR